MIEITLRTDYIGNYIRKRKKEIQKGQKRESERQSNKKG